MSQDWYKTFFHGLAVDLWCKAVSPEQTTTEVDFLVRALQLKPGSRVLDVPCGSGRHSISLAQRGHQCTGIDISRDFLSVARQSNSDAGVEVEFREGDACEMDLGESYDAAFCMGNSFSYFEPALTSRFVRKLAGALRPGGRLVIATGLAAEGILPNLELEASYDADGVKTQIRRQYVVEKSRIDVEYSFEFDGRSQVGQVWYWVLTVREICEMLGAAGLRVAGLYRSFEFEPFRLGDPYLHIVAEKPAA